MKSSENMKMVNVLKNVQTLKIVNIFIILINRIFILKWLKGTNEYSIKIIS